MNNLVSIVVPVYNVEKYLDRCLESIVNQSYKNLDIILVDDESKDNSGQLCEEWAKKDSRIQVVHKKNAGLGMARNTGIEHAKGDYICFCDSDDRIDPYTIEKTLSAMLENNADIGNFGFNYINQNEVVFKKRYPNESKVFKGEQVQKEFLPSMMGTNPKTGKDYGYCMSSCASLYRLSLIKELNWRFVSERVIISEDFYSLLSLYKHVKTVVTISEPFYYYYLNEASLTHTFRKDRFEKNKYFYQEALKLINELNYNDDVKTRLGYLFLGNTIATMKQIVKLNDNLKVKMKYLKDIVHDDVLGKVVEELYVFESAIQRKVLMFSIKYKLDLFSYLLLKAKS